MWGILVHLRHPYRVPPFSHLTVDQLTAEN
jgi:hypothetical protein